MKLRTASVIGAAADISLASARVRQPSSSSSSAPTIEYEPGGLPAREHGREQRRAIRPLERLAAAGPSSRPR